MITLVSSEAQAYLSKHGLLTDEVKERIENETIGKLHPRFTECKCLPYKLKRELDFAIDAAANRQIDYFHTDEAKKRYGDEAEGHLVDWLVGLQSSSNIIKGMDDCESIEELEVLWKVEELLTK